MARNLIVCADGTGNEGGTEDESNVFKLFRLLADEEAELAYYDQGLGTERLPLLGKAFGVGISENICDCYRFLVENYEPGDSIFLFGFSRGAFTVRSLAGLIARSGLLRRRYRVLIKQAYRLYKRAAKDPDACRKFKRTFAVPAPPRIRLIGVWDTVGALGLPIRWLDKLNPFAHRFHDTRLGADVDFAYHALAIDDRRRTFHPTLWTQPGVDGQTIEQVWMLGMHSDVGGGDRDHSLSDIPLEWMIQKAEDRGLRFMPGWQYSLCPDPAGRMHDSRAGWGWFYRRKVRDIPRFAACYGIEEVLVHDSVDVRRQHADCGYDPRNLPEHYTTVANRPLPEE
jgi:uncharacterized protein (DUF2235 family)